MSESLTKNNLIYAETEEIAGKRYEKYRSDDPFPEILPALLNSADIADYVEKTAMIYPFNPEELKPASYEMVIGGEVLHWNEKNEKIHFKDLKKAKTITLRKNSITFVTVDAKFQLPDYIAMRFNFQIQHVHCGLLLGTGPLINPGFRGKLMIPIHNLTSNNYDIKYGEPLIGVEFTKLSPNVRYSKDINPPMPRSGEFIQNHGKKNDKTFIDFITKSLPFGISSVQASISKTLADADESLKKTEIQLKSNQTFVDKVKNWSYAGIIAAFIGLVALVFTSWSIIGDANKYVSDATMLFKNEKSKLYQLRDVKKLEDMINNDSIQMKTLIDMRRQLIDLKVENRSLKKTISSLLERIKKLEEKIGGKMTSAEPSSIQKQEQKSE